MENLDKDDNGDAKVMIIYNKVSNPGDWTAKIDIVDSDGTVGLSMKLNSTTVAAPFEALGPNNE